MKVRLQDAQRHNCTISSFFFRVPRRVGLWPPQCGQASGSLELSGTRAMRGMDDILLIVCAHRIMQRTEIEKPAHADSMRDGSRIWKRRGARECEVEGLDGDRWAPQ